MAFLFVSCGVLRCGAQDFALKSNALYWGASTPNLSAEIALADRWTLELAGAYNPWTVTGAKKLRLWAAQPELRYWPCWKFGGHFFGLHIQGSQFYSVLHSKIRDGYLAGAGLSYGYAWLLSKHWNLEAEIGLGYNHIWYKEYPDLPCVKCKQDKHADYVGPTRAALSVVYLF